MNRSSFVSDRVRRWAIRMGVAVLAFEIFYVVAGNAFIRSEAFSKLVNKKPEKTSVSWNSAFTWLPGVASVEGFTLTSQTLRNQVYVHVGEAKARISLVKLPFKTIHIRGVDAANVDVRYRPRLDRPPKAGAEEETAKEPTNVEYWPEIPGLTNPPDPKPEDLYPKKRKKRPWTISITGAHVDGPIRVAIRELVIEGDGWAGGGVTVVPRDRVTIHRGTLGLSSATVAIGPETLADRLVLAADVKIDSFPAKGAKPADVLGGISGELVVEGELGEKATVRHEITPGLTTFGAGKINARLVLKRGVLSKGSEYSLQSESFRVRVMDLDVRGTASVSGATVKEHGEHVTRTKVVFDSFELVNPENESVGVTGSGAELDAEWNGLSIAGGVPAALADLVLPRALINDVRVFNALIPDRSGLTLDSGTGEVEAVLHVEERVADGTIDVEANDVVFSNKGTPFHGDLEVHANLAEGDLPARVFDLSGTSIRLDDIIDRKTLDDEQRKREAWFCTVDLDEGEVTLGRPISAAGSVVVTMYDTRPVTALLKDLGTGPKWLGLVPTIKHVEGSFGIDFGSGALALDEIALTGEGLEVLGWLHIKDKKADGRLLIDYKALIAGVRLDHGKGKVILSKPRKWFAEEGAQQ